MGSGPVFAREARFFGVDPTRIVRDAQTLSRDLQQNLLRRKLVERAQHELGLIERTLTDREIHELWARTSAAKAAPAPAKTSAAPAKNNIPVKSNTSTKGDTATAKDTKKETTKGAAAVKDTKKNPGTTQQKATPKSTAQ